MLRGNWLSTLCSQVEQEFGVQISDYARQFILQSAEAMAFDPHPAWRRGDFQHSPEALQEFIAAGLREVAGSDSAQRYHVVTYFHILHWFMDNAVALRGFPVPKDG